MKITTVKDILIFMIYYGVIIYRIELIHHDLFSLPDRVKNRAQHLGNTAKRIILLYLVFKNIVLDVLRIIEMLGTAADQPAPFQYITQHGSHIVLTRVLFYNIQLK